MPEMIYSFNGKDITMNVCIQIRDVLKLLQQHFHISFEEAALKFYKSETYIADRYYDEISPIVLENLSGKSAFDK